MVRSCCWFEAGTVTLKARFGSPSTSKVAALPVLPAITIFGALLLKAPAALTETVPAAHRGWLLVTHTDLGILALIDPATGVSRQIPLTGPGLVAGTLDGLQLGAISDAFGIFNKVFSIGTLNIDADFDLSQHFTSLKSLVALTSTQVESDEVQEPYTID